MSTCTHANYTQIWNCHELWMQTEGNQKKRDIEPNVGYNCVPGTPAYPFCFKADRLLSTYKCLCKIQLQTSLSYLVKTRVPDIHICWYSVMICNSLQLQLYMNTYALSIVPNISALHIKLTLHAQHAPVCTKKIQEAPSSVAPANVSCHMHLRQPNL